MPSCQTPAAEPTLWRCLFRSPLTPYDLDRFPDDRNRYELLDGDDRAILVSRPGEAPDRPYRDQLQWSPLGLGQTFVIEIEPLFRGLE